MESIGKPFDLDCSVMIIDKRHQEANKMFIKKVKMVKIVHKTNISSVFIHLEKRIYCAYFIHLNSLQETKKIIKEISERSLNIFQQFTWFIIVSEVSSDLGVKLQLNTNIKLVHFMPDKCDIYEVYGLGGVSVINKIGTVDAGGRGQIRSGDKLQRIKDLQGVTLR